LRQAARTTLTFKQASPDPLVRHEWELEVVPLETAQELLEQLGYQVILVYEKYRQVYSLGDAHFMLDELPFGDFVEVETGSPAGLEQTASRGGQDWGRRIDTTTSPNKPPSKHSVASLKSAAACSAWPTPPNRCPRPTSERLGTEPSLPGVGRAGAETLARQGARAQG
jgi:hypothetical protein